MRLPSLLLLCALSTAAHAQAANTRWQDIGKTSSGNTVYVDARSVKDSVGMKVALVRTVYAEPVSTPQGPITGSRARAMFDCANQKVAVLENIIYHDERANRIYRQSAPRQPGFGPALQSTFAHVAMQHLCAARR
ncbi:hypothetical protein Strain138_002561 [Pseudogemmatithrix spongiicola]|uniref:Surface-adhesin protein E-like domain-containing protein n=1 Tax=Pseudogemmatithrix spongiicola TaxID=3062599 RepID=A0AA49Q620_9BACT|nr:hypothetical protein Strain138_002561 [Gemmatimonadaceae bacterium 'strain 138']WKW16151.1 hypothetical protein Strain318_002561 [Gemmatimonadaceae bacterium 'strain 318']